MDNLIVSLVEAKNFLRVDDEADDELITNLLFYAQDLCCEIARAELEEIEQITATRAAISYIVAYMYEHREEPKINTLKLNVRAMLSSWRYEKF